MRTVASGGKCGIVTRWQMVGIGDHHGVDGMDGMVVGRYGREKGETR